jgi:hypothetical protein
VESQKARASISNRITYTNTKKRYNIPNNGDIYSTNDDLPATSAGSERGSSHLN